MFLGGKFTTKSLSALLSIDRRDADNSTVQRAQSTTLFPSTLQRTPRASFFRAGGLLERSDHRPELSLCVSQAGAATDSIHNAPVFRQKGNIHRSVRSNEQSHIQIAPATGMVDLESLARAGNFG